MKHCDPFTPTYPKPEGEAQIRVWIAEARAYNWSGYMLDDKTAPLPEFYPGHYERYFGLTATDDPESR